MNNNKKINYLFMSTALLSILISSTIVQANEIVTGETIIANKNENSDVGIDEGELVLNASRIISFGTHQIENKKKTVTTGFEKDFNIIDARGTHQGWDLIVSATPFEIVEPSNGWIKENPYKLPIGSLNLETAKSLKGVNNEDLSVRPTINDLNVAIDIGEFITVVNADIDKGMGEHAINFGTDALSLVIDPITAKIDKINYPNSVTPYESTITWSLVSGPKIIN